MRFSRKGILTGRYAEIRECLDCGEKTVLSCETCMDPYCTAHVDLHVCGRETLED